MLLVKTEIKPSSISGYGLFASEFIPKGTAIWEFSGLIDITLTKEMYFMLPKIAADYYDNFSYYNENEGGFILCGDNAKYTNHSSSPKTIFTNGKTITIVDIKAGEEITENYYMFDECANKKLNK